MMSTRELYEMATLDVLGLLDDDERAEFEAAFRAASPEVQARVRREQRRQADIERLLPQVEPPAGLKARVLSAVREAITSMSEPVGQIGPAAPTSWFNSVTVWRAACIGFATASVILAGFFYVTASQLRDIDITNTNTAAIKAFSDEYGPRFHNIMASAKTQRVSFTPPKPMSGKLTATLYVDPETREAFLLGDHLPFASGNYQLSVRTGEGSEVRTKRLTEFSGNGGPVYCHIEELDMDDIGNLAIEDPGRPGEPILHVSQNL